MNQKIVGMLSGYPGLSQSDWLWQQTPHPFGSWGQIQMLATAPKPDFLLLYNFAELPQVSPRKKFGLFQKQTKSVPHNQELQFKFRGVPKEKIIFLWREPPLINVVQTCLACYQWGQEYCGYVSAPDDAAPIPDYMPAIWYPSNSFRELNEMQSPEKVKACSWVTSGIDRSENHQRRLEFLRLLQAQGVKFDLYGRQLPNWAKSCGELSNKWHGMAHYYYYLAIENYAENQWYVSEKLWDALLAWCLPIYYGGPAADRLLPPGSFLRLPSLDEKGLAYIQEVIATPDAWNAAKDAIAEARQVILHQLNLLAWLDKFVKKIS